VIPNDDDNNVSGGDQDSYSPTFLSVRGRHHISEGALRVQMVGVVCRRTSIVWSAGGTLAAHPG
jgi:hypothetical protein